MAITYFQTISTSDLTGPTGTGGITNDLVASTSSGGGAQSVGSGNMNSGVFCNKNFFTPTGDPGINGATGNYTVVVNVSVQNANIGIRIFLRRYNGAGTPQGTDVEASEGSQTAGAATRTFTWTAASLGTWTSGDRLLVRVQLTNISGSMNQAASIQVGSSADTIDTPFTTSGPVALDGVIAVIGDSASSIDLAVDLVGPVAVIADSTGTAQLAVAVDGIIAAVTDLTGAIETPVTLDGVIDIVVGSVVAALSVYPTDIIDGGDTATPPTDIILSTQLGEPVTDLGGDLTVTGGEQTLDGTIAAISDLAGASQLAIDLGGPISSITDLTGDLTVQAPGSQALDGVIAAIGHLAGDLSVQAPTQHALAGIVTAVSDLTGELTVEAPGEQALTGTIAAIADTAGTAQAAIALDGPVAAVTDLVGVVSVAVPLQAANDSVAHLTGALTVEAPGQQELAGTIDAVTEATGALTADFVVEAVNAIVADLAADLTVILWGFNEPAVLALTAVDDSSTLSAVPDGLILVAVTED